MQVDFDMYNLNIIMIYNNHNMKCIAHVTRAREQVDFDDMMHLTLFLLRRDSVAANKLKNRFQFLFVDEYQVSCAWDRARAILLSLFP